MVNMKKSLRPDSLLEVKVRTLDFLENYSCLYECKEKNQTKQHITTHVYTEMDIDMDIDMNISIHRYR